MMHAPSGNARRHQAGRALPQPRFGDTPSTNPEELLSAAPAGCFTMDAKLKS